MYYPNGGLALLGEVVFSSSVLMVTLVVAMAQTGSTHVLLSCSSFYHFGKKRQWGKKSF